MSFIEEGMVHSVLQMTDHILRLKELATRYSEKNPGLADLCLIVLSEMNPKIPVLTTDLKDFRVYK